MVEVVHNFEVLFERDYGGYSEEYVESLLDDDEVSNEEAGFWEGEIRAEEHMINQKDD